MYRKRTGSENSVHVRLCDSMRYQTGIIDVVQWVNSISMLVHFFKTAFRNLKANKVYSILTVAGLGVGIAVFLVIFLFIRYQESYDAFHSKKANIYRILTKGDKPDDKAAACVPYPMPSALKHDFPDWKVTGIFSFTDLQLNTV